MFRFSTLAALALALTVPSIGAADGVWTSLFDGKSFAGWQANENPDSWQIENGSIVTRGPRSHLFYVGDLASHEFKNFELVAEVMTTPGSNSGIYVHTKFQEEGWPEAGYELQVINSNPSGGSYIERKMTGSIYAIRNTWQAPVPDNVWFEYRIRVSGHTLQTFINGRLICEYTESAAPFRPADKPGRLLGTGTIALQAHDPGSVVHYRSIKARLLPDDAPSLGKSLDDRELDELITQLSNDNVALIDLGIAVGRSGVSEEQRSEIRRYGLTVPSLTAIERAIQRGESIVILNDRVQGPDPEFLRKSKDAGAKIVFSSGGASQIDRARLKRRLGAIKAAGLSWRDLWTP